MEYIFFTGAPGSKWSGLAKWIYWSKDVNHSDYHDDREYYRTGDDFPGHTGAYWDPGMEFQLGEWDAPFKKDGGIKLIKSHTIAEDLEAYTDHPIIMVLRDDDKCFEWWKEAGGWNIDYPCYRYYENDDFMKSAIKAQNDGIREFVKNHDCLHVCNMLEVNRALGIGSPPTHNPRYPEEVLDNGMNRWLIDTDIEVYLYKP